MQQFLCLFVQAMMCWVFVVAAGPLAEQVAGEEESVLPAGVEPVWELAKAWRQATATREQVCINGLWQWQPAAVDADQVPQTNWGYFKVPGCWPGISDYMQKDCQQLFRHPNWQRQSLRDVKAAWYQREITVPATWTDRRVALQVSYINSYAEVFLDGQHAGSLRFPAGELDLTRLCQPGQTHRLSLLVVSLPLDAVLMSYNDTASVRQVAGQVARRGLCGDVYLTSTPPAVRIDDIKIDTSVRQWTIALGTLLRELDPGTQYRLGASITRAGKQVRELTSDPFQASDLQEGRLHWTEGWRPELLWDVHTPQNMYQLQLTLTTASGRVCDVSQPIPFGFREFWIDGRDFYLNGTRIYLSSVPLDNAQIGAAWATYDAARESMRRLHSFGINFVYTHNYGCQPGSHLGFQEILRAADDEGMLISFSQPHFGHYEWDAEDAAQQNGYAPHAAFYVREAQNHPSVVAYSTSHNATGYADDMNPDMIDGIHAERGQWSTRNVNRR